MIEASGFTCLQAPEPVEALALALARRVGKQGCLLYAHPSVFYKPTLTAFRFSSSWVDHPRAAGALPLVINRGNHEGFAPTDVK